MDKPLTVAEVGKLLGFSADTIVRLFKDEPGVIRTVSPKVETRSVQKRRYVSYRIPQFVYERVARRLSK